MSNLAVVDRSAEIRTAERFSRAVARRSTYHYVVSKLKRDPATQAVAELGPLGDVIDLGCGRGHLAVYLLERGVATRIRGYDWDEEKVGLAKRASEGLAADFSTLDVRKADTEPGDTVLLIDVLHYMPADAQDALLVRAAELVKPGGRLVIRDVTSGAGWRSAITRFVEWISMGIRFNLGERIAVRNIAGELVPILEKQGFTCTVTPCWRGTPFANVLLVARRSASEAST